MMTMKAEKISSVALSNPKEEECETCFKAQQLQRRSIISQ